MQTRGDTDPREPGAKQPIARQGEIACLIPVYNGHSKLHRTLSSLNGQAVPLTVVLVDDGSTPPLTVDPSVYDYPITVLRMPQNGGIERALNCGLQHILEEGYEFVARLDNGDTCRPDRLRVQLEFLHANSHVALVGSQLEWITDAGAIAFQTEYPAEHRDIIRRMHSNSCIGHVTVMFRTRILHEIGVYHLGYPAAEDYELFWRVARRYQVANIPRVLVQAQLDKSGISLSRRRNQLSSRLKIQTKNFDAGDPHSYLGVCKTLLLLVTPNPLILWVKGVLFRESRRSRTTG